MRDAALNLTTIKRSAISLAVVLAAYWLYALVAVPLIEPTIRLAETTGSSAREREEARNRPAARHEELRAWFTERDWELTSQKLFEAGGAILLCNEYTNGSDGMLMLTPCTVVILADKAGKSIEQWRREAVILQAAEARLKFEKLPQLMSASLGNLQSGQLVGRFTIRSDQKDPGPADDLFIVSQDAQLADNRITSPHPIQFRLGSSFGSGRDLRIDLVPGGSGTYNGVSRLQINRDVKMHIELGSLQKPAAAQADPVAPPDEKRQGLGELMGGGKGPQPPLQITCQGPFEFDFAQYVARFRDVVDVLRLHPEGQSDSLKGDLLSLFFAPIGPAPAPGRIAQLEPDRIEVRGLPVVMDSPMQKMRAQGEHLIYQFGVERITLEGQRPVVVERDGSRIEAPKLIYELPPRSAATRFGRFSAIGPGRLQAVSPDRPNEIYRAQWTKHALFGPDQGHHIVSLLGEASFEEAQTGKLAGEEIYVWLNEQPEGARIPLLPERLLAQGHVALDSAEMACQVEMLQVWFVTDGLRADPRIEELPPPDQVGLQTRDGHSRAVRLVAYRDAVEASVTPGRWRPAPTTSAGPLTVTPAAYKSAEEQRADGPALRRLPPIDMPGAGGRQARATHGKSKYAVRGKVLQVEMKLVPGGNGQIEAKPSQLRVRENVRVTETVVGEVGQAPLVLLGDQVDFKQTRDDDAQLNVMGEPAHVEGRGMTLEGPVIRLDRGTSQLDVEGAGTMTLPADRDMQGQPLGESKPLRVSWLKYLHFDGRTAHFEDRVHAEFDGQTLRAHTMDVAFTRPVNFANPAGERPEVADLICRGRVTIEGSTLDSNGQLASIERMESGELRVNRPTGAVTAQGPGTMVTVRKGGLTMSGGLLGPPHSEGSGATTADELTYVRVDFTNRADGNLNLRTMTFGNRVKTIFGPVTSWDGVVTLDDLDRMGPDRRHLAQRCGFLQSERLTVAQMRRADGGSSIEIDSSGNASFEGFNFQNESFVAKGNHIKYAQEKELVILEGDGRTDAELIRWNGSGADGQRATSRKIDFWLATKERPPRVQVDGARHLDLTMPQRPAPPARPTPSPFVGAPTRPPGAGPMGGPGASLGFGGGEPNVEFGGPPGAGYSGIGSSP